MRFVMRKYFPHARGGNPPFSQPSVKARLAPAVPRSIHFHPRQLGAAGMTRATSL